MRALRVQCQERTRSARTAFPRWSVGTRKKVIHFKKYMGNKLRIVRIDETAEALGVSTETVRRWERAGKITSERSLP